jgi:hypothetical protein
MVFINTDAATPFLTANGISVQNVNVLPNIYGHIFENSPYI